MSAALHLRDGRSHSRAPASRVSFRRVKPQLNRNKTLPADLLTAAVIHCLHSARTPINFPS